ncbi:MAG: hypothetical protein L0Y54_07280 [Sporichthyaceae bacterium]|nr:hypothetical protein [Sporichthyaceae bacterium]
MAVLAGETIIAGKVPGERIATDIDTADSATFTTTETEVQSVTAALVSGRTYRIRWATRFESSVADDRVIARIREDNSTGSELSNMVVRMFTVGSIGWPVTIEAEYTAVATGNKTFSATGVRQSGTGNCFMEAAANRPSYLYVDYIRG